jgi:hypothetical protein
MNNEIKYRVAVVVYPEGDAHLVFKDQPEIVCIEDSPCFVPDDITSTAAIVTRRLEQAIADYESKDEYDNA